MDRMTTLQNGDVIGRKATHQNRSIGVDKRRVFCCCEQLHRYGTLIDECLKVPSIAPQELTDPAHIKHQPVLYGVLGVPA